MAINVSASYQSSITAVYESKVTVTADTAAEAEQALATLTQKSDGFEKSKETPSVTYKPDDKKIKAMKSEMSNNINAFTKMVEGLVGKQAGVASGAASLEELLNITDKARADAQAAISEDGYWGVEQTATRILDFAKALSGGDPAKAEMLRKAVQDGFEAAYGVMGGKDKAPSITQQTYDRVMKGFDDWVNGTDSTKEETGAAKVEEKA